MRVLYLLLILVAVGTGCEKYNLKQPAYLNLNWRFHSVCNGQGNYVINKGFFYSKEFTVSGIREKGSAVEITKSLPVQKVQFSTQDNLAISLDVPMGDYTEFSLKTIIDKSNNPSIRLEGIYIKGSETFPMVIEWTDLDDLNFKILNPFFLQKKKNYQVYIGFDINKLFSTIPSSLSNDPAKPNQNGTPTVVISKDYNVQMFNKITEQIPNALVLKVE
ncbi:MAG: hypothetical protein K0S23_3005 [Fluviicola sp.]|jgi:hypothetical protein|uniref:hypothetical protein n=1 Tax=Fluviicola sp. TaxID=1917219 RepID=UPI00261DD81B|nr:hypothetical protein [Fluviicola sp.]MDF3028698.1 hypothetical protein [Fluviicola sp.]